MVGAFTGTGVVGQRHPSGQVVPARIQFPIEAPSLKIAFERFDEALEMFVNAQNKAAPKIAIPSVADTAKIITP